MLKKRYRLRKRGSFAYVRTHGTKYNDRYLTLGVVRGNCKLVGFVVSNKIGKAVKRNLVKRRMRGAVRELWTSIGSGQYIFSARTGITELGYAEIKERISALIAKACGVKGAAAENRT